MNVVMADTATPAGTTSIRYFTFEEFPGWLEGPALLNSLIERFSPKVVLEIGSGANPTMSIADVARWNVQYITSDIDEAELKKADPVYQTRCVDFSEGELPEDLIGHCDLVFSRMVNEHVRDGKRYHTNIFRMLAPGGVAVHAFSTLYTLPFLANYLMPTGLSARLLQYFAPRDTHQYEKFPAHYSWSRGPTGLALARFRDIGYEIVSYDGYFGHGYYRRRSAFLHNLEMLKTRLLLRAKLPIFCAYAVVVLRKPR
jgi:2-polyprenyl-3-methyl-5-hydroxy-6-metoxy-1,4-benzoquinol methylase